MTGAQRANWWADKLLLVVLPAAGVFIGMYSTQETLKVEMNHLKTTVNDNKLDREADMMNFKREIREDFRVLQDRIDRLVLK